MTQVDIGRVALGAPALQQVFVVSRPECLLIKSWARNERSNTEDAAALIGNLFRDCDDALDAVGGAAEPRTLMVESNDRVLVVARVAEDMAAAFVFEQAAPLGLIRVQARQLTAQLARTLAQDPSRPPPTNGAGEPARGPAAPPGGRQTATRDLPRGGPGPDRGAAQTRSPAFGIPAVERSPAFGIPAVQERSPAFGVAPAQRSPAFGVNPATERSSAFGVAPASPNAPQANETTTARLEQLAVRITAFTQSANDPRSALLRLSLRTGLPMELLERPSALSSAQAEHVSRVLDELQKRPG